MASVLSLPELPAACPPFVFTDSRIRRLLDTDDLWYLHSRKTGKFHGPFRKETARDRIRLTGPWRRGLDGHLAFPPPPPAQPLRLSAAQERLLRNGLRSVNRRSTVPEVWRFERTRNGLRISLLGHRPFRWATWERRFDALAVVKASEDLRTTLLGWRNRPSAITDASALEEPGRRLFRHLLGGTEAATLLFAQDSSACLLLPDAFFASVPLELMAERTFLCLVRPVSRAPETFGPTAETEDCAPPSLPHLLAFADPEPPPGLEALERLLRRERCPTILARATPKNLRQLLAPPGGMCFVGHGGWRRGRFVWQDRRRTVTLDPEAGKTPAFVLSDTCNTRFFSPEFLRFFGRMSSSGTLCWVGAWSETDYGSTAFAEAFYASFLRGASAAEAVLAARQDLWARGHPEALLFGCAGDPGGTSASFRTFRTG